VPRECRAMDSIVSWRSTCPRIPRHALGTFGPLFDLHSVVQRQDGPLIDVTPLQYPCRFVRCELSNNDFESCKKHLGQISYVTENGVRHLDRAIGRRWPTVLSRIFDSDLPIFYRPIAHRSTNGNALPRPWCERRSSYPNLPTVRKMRQGLSPPARVRKRHRATADQWCR
jgi:hypothetical protein